MSEFNKKRLILIDGGPASGKNTLGDLLVIKFSNQGQQTILLDLDTYVERYNPKWIWSDDKSRENDFKEARIDFKKDIVFNLEKNENVIVIGERFLTINDIHSFVSAISVDCDVYIYHLSVPFEIREQRLHLRGPHTLIDLPKDQKERNAIKNWPGYVYENINSPEEDAESLMQLIMKGCGLLNLEAIQNKMMPNVLVLTGPGGSGKTTIAKLVADRCGYFYLDGDNEDTEYFPDGNQWLSENSDNLQKVHEKILNKTKLLVEQGNSVIVDYIVFGRYKEFFEMFKKEFKDELRIKVLFPSEEETIKRDKERECWTTGEERINAVRKELLNIKDCLGKENYIDTTGLSPEETLKIYFSDTCKQ